MVFKVGREETLKEETQLHWGSRSWTWQSSAGRLCTSIRQIPVPLPRGSGERARRSSTLARRVPGLLPASAWTLPAVFPGTNRLPVGSICGYHWAMAMATSVLDVLIQPWRESEGFPCDLGSLGNAHRLWEPSKQHRIKLVFPHQHSEKQHEYFRRVDVNRWIEDLYPSTIHKVHHEWRL